MDVVSEIKIVVDKCREDMNKMQNKRQNPTTEEYHNTWPKMARVGVTKMESYIRGVTMRIVRCRFPVGLRCRDRVWNPASRGAVGRIPGHSPADVCCAKLQWILSYFKMTTVGRV